MSEEKYCLVLSGGGAKGVYHIGAWKALRELGVDIEAVVGNSIGAVIGAFVAQGSFREIEEIGNRIGLDYILNIPKDLIKDGELSINKSKRTAFLEFYKATVTRKGLDTSPWRNLMETHLNEEKIRNGNIDFGVVTYNISDMKPREVFIEEMEEDELISFAMASSAFPGFERPEIAGKKYIDGGVYDNIPFTMAKSRGYNNIIVIDISGAGINRKPDITGTRTVYIKNSINMGGVLDFDKKFMESFKTLGYLDTMKTFGCLRGIDYFIEPDATLEKDFHDFMKTEVIQQKLFTLPLTRKSGGRAPRNLTEAVSRLLPKKRRHDPVWLPLFVDCAANILAVEQVRKWQYQDLFNTIIEKEAEVQAEAENLEKSSNREFASRIRKDLKERKLIGNPYIYSLMGDRYLPGRLKISLEKFVIEHYPELAAGVFFIEVLEEFRMYLQGARV